MARSPATRRPQRPNLFRRPDTEPSRRGDRFQFIGETVSELKKVTWPTRDEATRLTVLVLLISLAIGALLGLIDLGFSQLFNRLVFGGG